MLISDASPSADSAASLASMSSSLASDADSLTFLQNREAAAAFLRCMPFPTPKRRSTIHTCSPAAAQLQQLPARPAKAAKLDNSPTASERSRQMFAATPSKTDKLPTHLPVPLQAWQVSVPLAAMDSQPVNVNGAGDGRWFVPSASRTSLAVVVPSASLMGVGVRALSPQPQSLLVLQPQPQRFHGHSASTGSRMGGSLVMNSKRMKHHVAGEPPLA